MFFSRIELIYNPYFMKYMTGKTRLDIVLNEDKKEYLGTFGPRSKSKIIDEALELHKNKDKVPAGQALAASPVTNVSVKI